MSSDLFQLYVDTFYDNVGEKLERQCTSGPLELRSTWMWMGLQIEHVMQTLPLKQDKNFT